MSLTKELLIEKSVQSASFKELAKRVGWLDGVDSDRVDEVVGRFKKVALGVCSKIELLLSRTESMRRLQFYKEQEDAEGHKEEQERLMDLTVEILDAGLGIPMALAAPTESKKTLSKAGKVVVPTSPKSTGKSKNLKSSKKPTTESKSSKKASSSKQPAQPVQEAETKSVPTESEMSPLLGKKRPGCSEEDAQKLRKTLKPLKDEVHSQPMRADVLGLAGVEYRDRQVIWLFLRPQVFGKEVVLDSSLRQVTLHNGILNHCALETAPSPYWSVLDAMADLGKFTKVEAVARAVELHGADRDRESYPTVEKFRSACSIAYDVLKTHHTHPRKRFAGMSHMVVNCGTANPEDKGKAEIRGRQAHETCEFFQEAKEKLSQARANGTPLASVEG